MEKWILLETIEREASTPAVFYSYKDAFAEMVARLAVVIDESVEAIMCAYSCGDPLDDDAGLTHDGAWAESYGQNFDYKIFHYKDGVFDSVEVV